MLAAERMRVVSATPAQCLRISPNTLAVHLSSLPGKLGMTSRAQLAAWMVEQGPLRDR
jgi:DNA-binding CsgD family transcriptional regulator